MPVFEIYHRQSLKQEPRIAMIGRWRVDYLAFEGPEGSTDLPLIVLGGAFQNFNSYKYCVESIQVDFPVILVYLQSLGNNDQLAPELVMEDLADLLHEFVVQMGLT